VGERESRGPQPLLIIIDGQKEWSSQALIGRPVNEVLAARLYCTLNTSRQEKEEKKKSQTGNITRAHLHVHVDVALARLPHTLRPSVRRLLSALVSSLTSQCVPPPGLLTKTDGQEQEQDQDKKRSN
jgi:hypothetical protein